MLANFGLQVADDDKEIKKILTNIEEKEKKLLQEYYNINNILKTFKEKNFLNFIPYLTEDLEKRKKFLLNKKLSKEKQHSALLKILEYLNLIDTKNKELETKKILEYLNLLEQELIPYKHLLM